MAEVADGDSLGVACAEASSAIAGIDTLGATGGPLAERIGNLEERQRELHQQRRFVMKQLKNATRKKKRIMAKARFLSDADLIQVVGARAAHAKAKAQAREPP